VISPPSPKPIEICQKQRLAWEAVAPPTPYFYDFIQTDMPSWRDAAKLILAMPNNTVSALLDYLCCSTCTARATRAFQTSLEDGGYQLDCSSKILKRLDLDKCNFKKSELALLNCFSSLTSAAWMPTLNLGLVALLIALW
jgi:hypothetical protein